MPLICRTAVAVLLAVGISSTSLSHEPARPRPNSIDSPRMAGELAEVAKTFLDALDPGMGATYLFNDAERGNFHYFPIPRRGVPLKDLNVGQRQLAYALMITVLSHDGIRKALTIMSLGEHLRESDEEPDVFRDSDQYYITVFGDPGPEATWGYRVEGFHLSLNVTVVSGRWIAVTPSFFGVIPATVRQGPRTGMEVLRYETKFARDLAKSLTVEQHGDGFGELPDFARTVGGLVTGNQRRIVRGHPRGLPASAMNSDQREMLIKLVREHVGRIRRELADQDLARIEQAGVEHIRFLWSGGLESGQPHHYIVQGPTFLIEYDNTQDDANHIHCVYRDFDNDFGDALLAHYRRHDGHDQRHGH